LSRDPIVYTGDDDFVWPDDPTRTGYDFGGWYTDNTSYESRIVQDDLNSYQTSIDLTLYAKWIAKTFQITFENTYDSPIEPLSVPYGEPLLAPDDPIRTGYEFLGW